MDIVKKINDLKIQKKALILAHVYTLPEIQDIADYVGDSLGLARKAAEINNDYEIIVFCGVYFMAETAAMLSPQTKVLLPDLNAGCPMADMAEAVDLQKLKAQYPAATVVCYVNSTAEIKAISDICVTSSNAVKIVTQLPNKQIIFVPDKSLGAYVANQCPEKEIILWDGFCPTHHRILVHFLERAISAHPNAKVLAHPENTAAILKMAHYIGSTGQMQQYAASSAANEFIIASENGLVYRLTKDNPTKKFYEVSPLATCPNMKKTTLMKVAEVLETESNQITVLPEIAQQAVRSIEKMLELS